MEQFLSLEKFGEKSANNLHRAIEKSKSNSLWQLIHGLGIPHVGKQSAKDLELTFDSLDAIADSKEEALEKVDGVGTIMAQSLCAWFEDNDNRELLDRLRKAGVNFSSRRSADASGDSPAAGKIFVLTGTLPELTRGEATTMIEAAGGRTSSSVSKKTDYLIAGEAAGSKYAKARDLGVEILNEDGLRKLLGHS